MRFTPLLLFLVLISCSSTPIEKLTLQAEKGDTKAQYELALRYETGSRIETDLNKAFYWYSKAADSGDTKAQYTVGTMYQTGTGTKADYAKALKYYMKAVDKQHVGAINSVGQMYDMGIGVSENDLVAVEFFKRGVDLYDANSMLSLGLMYAQGDGVKKNMITAFMWFETALFFANEPFGDKTAIPRITKVMKKLENRLTGVEHSNAKRGSANWIESRKTRETIVPAYAD